MKKSVVILLIVIFLFITVFVFAQYYSINLSPGDFGIEKQRNIFARSGITQCSDGIDNDGDGLIDCGNPDNILDLGDPGCWEDPLIPGVCLQRNNNERAATSECQDGIDNDGDELIDFPDDLQCISQQDYSEVIGLSIDLCGNDFCDEGEDVESCPEDCLITRVFVTSQEWNGNLGGLSGADIKCQSAADNANGGAGLGGIWKAWLSDGSQSAAFRLPHYSNKISNINGQIIAFNWQDLTDGFLVRAIDRDENGELINDEFVWTGTNFDGSLLDENCLNWNAVLSVFFGDAGNSSLSSEEWTNQESSACNSSNRLYCFEIPESTEWSPSSLTETKRYVYAWEPDTQEFDNFVTAYQETLLSNSSVRIEQAMQATELMPEGHKVMIVREQAYAEDLAENASDHVVDSNGEFVTYIDPDSGQEMTFKSVWWNNGVEDVMPRFENFFRDYSQAGGEVDFIVLDTEKWFSRTIMGGDLESEIDNLHWQAIENDPRFEDSEDNIRAGLIGLGFAPPNASLNNTVWQNIHYASPSEGYNNSFIWDVLMTKRVSDYVNGISYGQIKDYYPELEMSDFSHFLWNNNYVIPDVRGFFSRDFGGGSIVGNYNAPVIYGRLGAINLKDYDGDGEPEEYFQHTPFNSFKYYSNLLRSIYLANPGVSISPWVAPRSWTNNGINLFANDDYYQEVLIHAGMIGIDKYLYWNPFELGEDSDVLSETLEELDFFTGYEESILLTTELFEWEPPVILTGVNVGDYDVWRFTPRLQNGERIEDTIFKESNDVIFKVNRSVVVFPDSEIIRIDSPASKKGYWIVQQEFANEPFVVESECADGIDNDNDGLIDFPEDFGCEDFYDNSELSEFICGNGYQEGIEQCDGEDVLGFSCESFGFSGGILECNSICRFDISQCENGSEFSRVFVTNQKWKGDFGGLVEADTICQNAAESGNGFGLGGVWRAWLSNNAISASKRLYHSQNSYILTDGTFLADNWEDLTDGIIESPINKDENGELINDEFSWTGTNSSGHLWMNVGGEAKHCNAWRTNSADEFGLNGDTDLANEAWTEAFTSGCSSQRHLYCFEQPIVPDSCGDEVVNDLSGETCDDGNNFNEDGCSLLCQTEDRWVCSGQPSICLPDGDGDGVADVNDFCDGTFEGEQIDKNGCSQRQVDSDGDGICEGKAISGLWCPLGNNDNCPFVPNSGQQDLDGDGIGDACDIQTCGNNQIEGTEVCDGTDFGEMTCESIGYDGGNLECNNDCSEVSSSSCLHVFDENRVFVTNQKWKGNLGGVSGADAKCQEAADNANEGFGIGGVWKAWISSPSSEAIDRLYNSDEPYFLLNGQTIAFNWQDLTDGFLVRAIDRDENGELINDEFAWTGTNSSGHLWFNTGGFSRHCDSWTLDVVGEFGLNGDTDLANEAWTEAFTSGCSSQRHLYCFEQPSTSGIFESPNFPENVLSGSGVYGKPSLREFNLIEFFKGLFGI